jgi:magnesium-transporting ATPase (P-type)
MSRNIAFGSCFCLEGNGYGVVVRTGDLTYMGTIAHSTLSTEAPKTIL